MNRRIVIPQGAGKKISRDMKCSIQFVSYSLNFKQNSELSRKIREIAKDQYGGVEIGG